MAERDSAVLDIWIEDPAHVLRVREVFEERTEVREFCVVRVVEPRRHWYRIVRVEYVRGRRVVEDDGVAYGTAEL